MILISRRRQRQRRKREKREEEQQSSFVSNRIEASPFDQHRSFARVETRRSTEKSVSVTAKTNEQMFLFTLDKRSKRDWTSQMIIDWPINLIDPSLIQGH